MINNLPTVRLYLAEYVLFSNCWTMQDFPTPKITNINYNYDYVFKLFYQPII